MTRTERNLKQGKALDPIDSTGPIQRTIAWLLLKAYRRGLRAIVATAPAWVSEEILSASQAVTTDGAVLWLPVS